MSHSSSSQDSATLNDFVGLLRMRKGLVVLVLGIVVLTTLGVTALLPKWHLSTAKISIQKPESEVKLFQAQGNSYFDPYFIQDQFRIIQAEKILYPVIEKLKLADSLGFMVELLEPSVPRLAFFDTMREAAESWDGTNPVIGGP